MASLLNTKINSYNLERGIEFSETVVHPPTRTGSNELGAFLTPSTTPVYEPTIGPVNGAGSWRFTASASGATRVATNDTPELAGLDDEDWTQGFWFKISTLPTMSASGTNTNGINLGGFTVFPNNAGWSAYVVPANSTATSSAESGSVALAGRIIFNFTSTINVFTPVIVPDNWYYIAARRVGTTMEAYLNGTYLGSETNTNLDGTVARISIGSVSHFNNNSPQFWVSNYHQSTSSAVDATAIAEIWSVGSGGTSVTITDIPAEASALIVAPTIVIVANDNVQVTTSILVSAEFPQNITANGIKNTNIVVIDILQASTELLDNVIITTGTDESFSAEEFTAFAEIVKPFLTEEPMTASAIMPNATAVVQASYYSMVKSLDPVLYYNFDGTTMQNYGSWNIASSVIGSTVTKNNASTGDMSLIGAGKSWKFNGNYNNAPNFVDVLPQQSQGYVPKTYNPFAPPLGIDPITDLTRSRSFAIEHWSTTKAQYSGIGVQFGNLDIRFAAGLMGYEIDATLPKWTEPTKAGVTGFSYERFDQDIPSNLVLSDWNHTVVNVQPAYDLDPNTQELVLSVTDQVVQFWVNGVLSSNIRYKMDYTELSKEDIRSDGSVRPKELEIFNTNEPGIVIPDPAFVSPPKPASEQGNRGFWRSRENLTDGGVLFDEIAIYDQTLTNSQIIDHYSFIANQNPNRNIFPTTLNALAQSGSHVLLIVSSINPVALPSSANAEIVTPSVVPGQNKNIISLPFTASALSTDVDVYFGWTIDAVAAIAYAERPATYFLNDIYYEYVKTNIAPYRYVTFDSADATLDYGTDNDFSVTPTTIGGTIVNPDLGINGRSVKTTGNSYTTDGVILNESEWNDSWGTGQNSYHSAFWFQRALDDASTTGLRVLWNLNGYKDNQHVVLYQYQGKLHMQFNNGSGTWIEQDTAALDLFDYQPHFIVIEFDHTNVNNNTVRLYVDAILKMTVNLGAYTGTTTNAASADSGPNNEANNRPRLSVGCLITPFVTTALPVIPTNTKLIIDEIYWDKNSITQTQVANVYNSMPGKTSIIVIALTSTSESTIVNPQISTSSIIFAETLDSDALVLTPTLILQFSNTYSANVANASADINEPFLGDNTIIVSDIFVASAIFNDAGVLVGLLALPMTASVSINPPSQIMGLPLTDLTDYVRYLRIESYNNEILHYQEVK